MLTKLIILFIIIIPWSISQTHRQWCHHVLFEQWCYWFLVYFHPFLTHKIRWSRCGNCCVVLLLFVLVLGFVFHSSFLLDLFPLDLWGWKSAPSLRQTKQSEDVSMFNVSVVLGLFFPIQRPQESFTPLLVSNWKDHFWPLTTETYIRSEQTHNGSARKFQAWSRICRLESPV